MPSSVTIPALEPQTIDAVPPGLKGAVVAVGNFDGMHAGHRALLDAAEDAARQRGVPTVVLTFEPHPRTVFRPDLPVFRLNPLPVKARLMRALGADGLVVAEFTPALAALSAEAFVSEVLVRHLNVSAAVVGYNFHFGKDRQGSPAGLQRAGERLGFPVIVVPEVFGPDGAAVSSSTIRAALEAGDVTAANGQLGYRWFVVGEVITGARRGRELGFPTANIDLGPDCRLRHGIYAVRLQRPDGAWHDGVASYGRRPTFDNGNPLLEVFVLDLSADLYGENVGVSFVDWIRPEARFRGVPELVAAIRQDAETARRVLAANRGGTDIDRALAPIV
jgi:riboflavin kinase/FMN adenylyltransferase